MHSFTPTLSFLLLIFLVPLQSALNLFGFFDGNGPVAFALAAELSPVNTTELAARSLNGPRNAHNSHRRRRSELGHTRNARPDLILYPGRRAAGAHFTFFKTGLGACGGFNQPGDFVVAMNMEQFDSGNHCGAAITITANGKTAHATIVDRCVGCGFNNLDFTSGLYAFFDPTMFGVINGDWEYGSGADPVISKKPTPRPSSTPTPTPKPSPKPTTTSTTKKTTTQQTSTRTSARTTTTSSTATSSTTKETSTEASTTTNNNLLPTPVAASPQVVDGNIEQAYLALLSMSGVIIGSLNASD